MESKSDAELVHLARAGNRDAYDELIRRYQHSIWGLACLLVHDPFEAEDMAQEAFLRAWRNLDLLSDSAKFGAWLRRIVFGVSVDWCACSVPNSTGQRLSVRNGSLSRRRRATSPRLSGSRQLN